MSSEFATGVTVGIIAAIVVSVLMAPLQGRIIANAIEDRYEAQAEEMLQTFQEGMDVDFNYESIMRESMEEAERMFNQQNQRRW